MIRTCLLFFTLFTLTNLLLHGQEEKKEEPVTIEDSYLPEEILKLSLAPLTKDELNLQVEAWFERLKAKAQQITDLEIDLVNEAGNQQEIKKSLISLREDKVKLINRSGIVLNAYGLKGGDISEKEQYLAVVKELKPGATDISAHYHASTSWLTSTEGGKKIVILFIKFSIILAIFWSISKIAGRLVSKIINGQEHISSLMKAFISKMTRRIILLIGIIIALGTLGVNVGAALALIGGGAFILAFALQDTLSNFAAGVMLILYRPFDVGDAVEIGGVTGKVASVSLVATTILTFDNQKILVPNKKVWGEVITNITGMATRRVDMLFGIGYNDDISLALEIIQRVVTEHPLILPQPEPNIALHDLGDSSVNIRCWPWAITGDFLTVRSEITYRVKEEFDKAGISIPFPQRDIHLYKAEGSQLP